MSNLQKHLISREDSITLELEYDKINYAEINKKRPPGLPDSKEFIFDLMVLKEYLDLIEKEMDYLGIKNKGLKITMGKYPEKFEHPNFNMKYLGYQTIFLSACVLPSSTENKLVVSDAENVEALSGTPNLNFAHLQPPY